MGGDSTNWEAAEASLWRHVLAFLGDAQRLRVILQIVILFGGAIAGAAQFFADSPDPSSKALWHTIGEIGVALIAICSVMLLVGERSSHSVMQQAKDAITGWRAAELSLARAEDKASDLDLKLREEEDRDVQFDFILAFLFQALLVRGTNSERTIGDFISTAGPRLIGPLKLASDADWTISVFIPKMVRGKEVMCRVGTSWKDQSRSKEDNRRWPMGMGWTGEAWRRAHEHHDQPWVIEHDAASKDSRAHFKTQGLEKPDDYVRFRSVAAIPFAGKSDKIAGVVTVTSGSLDTFSTTEKSQGLRNFDTLQTFTRIVAALVAGLD